MNKNENDIWATKWQYMEKKSKFDMHIFYYKNQKIFTSEWLRNKDRYF